MIEEMKLVDYDMHLVLLEVNDLVVDNVQDQIQALKEEYSHTVDNLRYRLENAELEMDRLRAVRVAALNHGPMSPERDMTPDKQMECSRELKVEERQSGEVSACNRQANITN